MNFYEKYLKYKNKYLMLKTKLQYNSTQTGGDKPLIKLPNKINLFTDELMEMYLNPIYGLIMCETGFITNNYWLKKSNFLLTPESILIWDISKSIPGTIQPTNEILKLKPIDFGRYIAIKYINKDIQFINISIKNKIVIDNINKKYRKTNGIVNPDDKKNLENYIKKFNKYVKLTELNDKIYFHIILYCFWWVANNDEGIIQYYNGINEVFTIINKYSNKQYELIDLNRINILEQQTFEKIVYDITNNIDLKIYNQEWSKNFCISTNNTYPDCGETTSRNLINLICYNENIFDIEILNKLNAIPELIEYYKKFSNFSLQSNNNYMPSIFNECLNSRDAWSKLIIKYANTNINFVKSCDNYGFELNSGMSLNKEEQTTNFFQLIKNLLQGINNWDDIKDDNTIMEIIDNTTNGVGDIEIIHSLYGDVVIHCMSGHFWMEIKKETNEYYYSYLSDNKKEIIDKLFKKTITIDNYLWINIDSNLLVEKINDNNTDINLKLKLFELSLTDSYDSDVRRRIILDVDSNYFKSMMDICGDNIKINDYTYQSTDFEFVNRLPNLINLNSKLKNNNLTSIDLLPLSYIETIGDGFLSKCNNLTEIDLSPLSNIKTIGNDFLFECNNLTEIDLSPLSNIQSIGNNFLFFCGNLRVINLLGLSNIQSIGNNFLSMCTNLTSIDLSELSNLQIIGDYFIDDCKNLTSIDLSPLSNIQTIGDSFLGGCDSLRSINLSGLSNIQTIGDYFIAACKNLTSIDLSPLSNIKTFGNYFLFNCYNLTYINLSGLSNIQTIGTYFLYNCKNLASINLSGLSNIQTISDHFLNDCCSLRSINLSGLSNIQIIGDNFLYRCNSLKSIDLSGLSNIQIIGDNFLYGCNSLKSINLSGLSNIQIIGDNFVKYTSISKIIYAENQKEVFEQQLNPEQLSFLELAILS